MISNGLLLNFISNNGRTNVSPPPPFIPQKKTLKQEREKKQVIKHCVITNVEIVLTFHLSETYSRRV